MDRKQEILRRLSEAGDFVSGQELCGEFQVSRTAVWKTIQKLKEEGYPIEAVTNKGYRLLSAQEPDILSEDRISARLTTAWVGRPLLCKEETGSTNDDVFALAAKGYPHGTLVVAARQTAGKGRRGRTWISPPDGNVYMSILLKPDLPPDITPMLTVVMALSVYQAALQLLPADSPAAVLPSPAQPDGPAAGLPSPAQPYSPAAVLPSPAQPDPPEAGLPAGPSAGKAAHPVSAAPSAPAAPLQQSAGPCRFGIKWPNDIVVSVNGGPYKKLCGILTEMRMEDNEISAITIGIGLNVNQTEFAPEIAENATSFRLALGQKTDRAALTAAVWNHFEENYSLFVRTRDFSGLRPAYEEGLVNKGRAVHVLDPRTPFTGTAVGINDRGELLVRPDDGGPVIAVGTGEVSVRGVQGYV